MRTCRALLATLLFSWLAISPAHANSLTGTSPVSGAILSTAPNSVTLTTEAPLAAMGSEVTVLDPKGSQIGRAHV